VKKWQEAEGVRKPEGNIVPDVSGVGSAGVKEQGA
jgi:hypothetical protein